VKIAEGCDHTCSFCAIPSFRGAFRSRPAQDVVAEVEALARRECARSTSSRRTRATTAAIAATREGLAGCSRP
jgi:radical SAM superfamily enzyme with C-terminal helix-hairpin-helix motif